MAIYHDLDNTGQEVQQRLDQVPVTQADLAEEVLARQAAVGAVQNNVDAEELRAKAAEKLNADDIDAIEEKIPSGASSSNKMATASDISSLDAAIEAILLLIPSAATSLNKLADKAFVNSSIATATATFRGTKNLVSDLNLAVDATHEQIAVALSEAVSEADNNDYAFVQVPTSSGTPTEIRVTERYKFDGTAWSYEYDLNNSGFTSDQWAAINSTITSVLVDKLNALPSNADLTAALGILTNGIAAINEKIPTAATSSNKLVDTAAMQSYITQILDGIDATFNVTSTDGHVTIQVTQVNGVVTNVAVTTSDIASAADVAQLFQLYNALSQSEPEIIQPADTWPLANPSTTVIYRVIDRVNTPPQNYSDYMFSASDLTTPVLMATYNNAIDPRPKKGSQNLVTSGGVFDNMGALDVSELNATENPHTPAIYADLSAALAAITSDYQKGGMSIKFVQGSVQSNDNKYVQARCMANAFTTDVTQWQGVDDEPSLNSPNLVKSGGVYDSITNSIYDKNIINSQEWEQTTRNSGYKSFGLTAGVKYYLTVQYYNFSDSAIDSIDDLNLYRSNSAGAVVQNLIPLLGGKDALKGNAIVGIEYTPSQNILSIAASFLASFAPDQGNEIRIKAYVYSNKFLTKSQQILTDEEKQIVQNNIGLIIDNEVADNPNLISNKGVYNALHEDVVYSSAEYEQTAANPPYTALRIKANSPSKVKIEFDGFNATQKSKCTGFVLYDSNHTEITTITNIFDGDYTKDMVELNCAPSTEVAYIKLQFISDTEMPASDTISIEVSETKEKYISDDGSKPLNGKTVLMLGDSITQLPYTGNNRSGMGIVEYFAEITGATTIRGGFGGSHIRARRIINSTADITDLSYVLAAFDMVYIVRALCTGDWTFQDYAIQYASEHSIDIDSYYPVMIAYLKQLDMTKVDYVTIFSGTNDYNNNVPVSDAEPTNIRYEYGAWNDILTNLSTTYPKLGVFVFTPIVKMIPDGSSWIWCEDAENEAHLKLTDYVQSNINAAYRFMFPSCDLYHTMGWNQYNFWEYFNSNDGTHPRKGYSHIARKMASFVIANQNRNFTL